VIDFQADLTGFGNLLGLSCLRRFPTTSTSSVTVGVLLNVK